MLRLSQSDNFLSRKRILSEKANKHHHFQEKLVKRIAQEIFNTQVHFDYSTRTMYSSQPVATAKLNTVNDLTING
jgi:hypothetical protein